MISNTPSNPDLSGHGNPLLPNFTNSSDIKIAQLYINFLRDGDFLPVLIACANKRRSDGTAVKHFLEVIKLCGATQTDRISQMIKELDSPFIQLITTSNIFTDVDADYIVNQIALSPGISIYDILTNKSRGFNNPLYNNTSLSKNESTRLIQGDLEIMAVIKGADDFLQKYFQTGYKDFQGISGRFNDGCYFDLSNPRPRGMVSQIRDWFYYTFSNKEKKRGETKIRFYLKPKCENLFIVLEGLTKLLQTEPEIRQYGFQTKIPNFFKLNEDIFIKRNQSDRMLFYFPIEIQNQAINIIRDYVNQNQDMFESFYSLGMPLMPNCDKFFVSSEYGGEQTFNSVQGDIISKIVSNFANFMNISLDDLEKSLASDLNLRDRLKKYMIRVYSNYALEYGINSQNKAFTNKHITDFFDQFS